MSHSEGGGDTDPMNKAPIFVYLCFPYGHPVGSKEYFKSVMQYLDKKGYIPLIPHTHFIEHEPNFAHDIYVMRRVIDRCDYVVLCADGEGWTIFDLPTKTQLMVLQYAKKKGKPVFSLDTL